MGGMAREVARHVVLVVQARFEDFQDVELVQDDCQRLMASFWRKYTTNIKPE